MENNTKKMLLVNWIVLLLAAVGMLLVSRFVSSAAGVMGSVLTGFGLLVALLSYFQAGLAGREYLERLEIEELSKSRAASLFTTADTETFPAKRAREQFEKVFVPLFTALLFVLQAAAAYWPWKMAAEMPPMAQDKASLAMALLGMFALILFLLGKYSSGLARLQGQRLL